MIFEYKNVKVNYEILGENNGAIPILFLHGWGGGITSFKGYAKYLSISHQCILLDFPPFGGSSDLFEPWGVVDYSNMVAALLSTLAIKKVNIVAHSFGGRIALYLASKRLVFVNKMLLTGCAGLKKNSIKTRIKIVWYKFVKFLVKIKLVKSNVLARFGSKDYKELDATMKMTFQKIVNYDERGLLKQISCPVLLFWGKNDKETPFCFTKTFKKNIKDCEVIVSTGDHFAYLQESNKFLRVAQAFFKR